MATIFFSYSHKDEALRDRLEVALTTMKRQGLIETWHDRRLRAGDDFDTGVRAELERADVILLLVSPDFIASDYCHDVEMTRAMERHERGEARVIPVILRPCDWHPMPFGKILGVPRDGLAITRWPDLDEAFLDVVKWIRAALPKPGPAPAPPRGVPGPEAAAPITGPRSSNLRLKKVFTEADRDRFLTDAYEYMARFFQGSLEELQERNEGIETNFRRLDANRFTAVVYDRGQAVSRCSVVLGGMLGKGISYSANDRAESNSFNENLRVDADDQGMFLRSLGMASRRTDDERKLTPEGASELYWELLIGRLQGR
ncbi:toll/interleukin-1 receptor domain-containing protein [Methylobacterium currus]|uniref:Toll/interleukin-1 receptor domain-containing protein n=1 Tax=Methylobacterium currus TaxID=2051553 RepID=A0A2R4WJV0_9HYPH|nr:toll/interleukin-1 receptor domain-containing protein [Methylobacterium currus]AWB21795.1 toll/interleukin-1 receptor domain-containing protein [Methylobacterium currus]